MAKKTLLITQAILDQLNVYYFADIAPALPAGSDPSEIGWAKIDHTVIEVTAEVHEKGWRLHIPLVKRPLDHLRQLAVEFDISPEGTPEDLAERIVQASRHYGVSADSDWSTGVGGAQGEPDPTPNPSAGRSPSTHAPEPRTADAEAIVARARRYGYASVQTVGEVVDAITADPLYVQDGEAGVPRGTRKLLADARAYLKREWAEAEAHQAEVDAADAGHRPYDH